MMRRLVTTDPATTVSDPTAPGTVLAGKYRVERTLGKGGMGVVVEARHIKLDDRVAIKFLLPEVAQNPDFSTRFLREAKAARRIKSEHVAHVIDVDQLESGAPYMVMEFLEGEDLAHMLETTGPLSIPDAVDYVIQGCEAIAEAHKQGIVHRDLKPANLFLTQGTDGSPIVKVLDFGISKTRESGVDNLTRTAALMGSALYMSPEQLTAPKSVDLRTDIYALGVSLYELLSGKPPFNGETVAELHVHVCTTTPAPLRSLRAEVPQALAAVIECAHARWPVNRYASIADFVVALAPFAPPRSQSTIERIGRIAGVTPPPSSQPGSQAAPALTPLPIAPPPPPPPSVHHIVPGPYHGPMSTRAAANFAQGATTGVNLSATRPTIKGAPPNRAGAFVLVALATLAFGVMGTAVVMIARRASSGTNLPQPSAAAASIASASAQARTPAPIETASASAPPAPEPPPPPSVSASAARPPDDVKPTPPDRRRPGPATRGAVAPGAATSPTPQPAKDDGSLVLPQSVYGSPRK
jgi:serine/threonine protein kinase